MNADYLYNYCCCSFALCVCACVCAFFCPSGGGPCFVLLQQATCSNGEQAHKRIHHHQYMCVMMSAWYEYVWVSSNTFVDVPISCNKLTWTRKDWISASAELRASRIGDTTALPSTTVRTRLHRHTCMWSWCWLKTTTQSFYHLAQVQSQGINRSTTTTKNQNRTACSDMRKEELDRDTRTASP